MDVVHHAFIGGAGFLTASAFGHELAGFSFLAASVFPDLDVLFMLFGKRFYLKHHQSITHSLLLAPIYAALLGAGLAYGFDVSFGWALFSGSLAGLVFHIVLDWSNTFRISLFLPATFKRYSLDAVFFIDGVAWGFTGLFYLLYGYFRIEPVLYLYPLLFFGYLTAKFFLHRHVVEDLKPLYAIPSSLNPFEFYVLENSGDNLVGYLYNAFRKTIRKKRRYPPVPEEYIDMASRSPVFRDMHHILRELHITDVSRNEAGTMIQARDIAVRNFRGRFGRTELEFDKDGRLVHEVANI
jgi:inner membrane protein